MSFITRYEVTARKPVIGFAAERTPTSAVAERFLTVHGRRIFYLGITCDNMPIPVREACLSVSSIAR